MKNTGIHHVSVMVRDAKRAFDFYHGVLGLNLTLNTVNQDDVTMYHLFFGDKKANAGTEFTLFEMKTYPEHVFGTNGIDRTYFTVSSFEALNYWVQRLNAHEIENYGVEEVGGQSLIRFEDQDGMRLGIVVKPQVSTKDRYVGKNIPEEYAIIAIGQVDLRVRYLEATQKLLKDQFGFVERDTYQDGKFEVLVMAIDNDWGHQVHVIRDQVNRRERLGVGGQHHVAFGVETVADLREIEAYLEDHNITNSGVVNREFFHALYFRDPNGIVIEVSSAMIHDSLVIPEQKDAFEEFELTLPTFLEGRRREIESYLGR